MLYVTNFLSGTVCPDGRFLYVVHGFPADTVPDVLITFPINANGTLGARRTARSSTSSARRVHANAIAG